MKSLLFIVLLSFPLLLFAQTEQKAPMLLGKITKEDLKQSPYNEWFDKGYQEYKPNQEIINQLKKLNVKDYTFTIFLGTWCSDSHREVPHMIKILEEAGISSDKISLIAVNRGGKVHKQSPNHEEKGLSIFRVPTLIVSKNGKEVNRIVEFPVCSLEKDLLAILSGMTYTSNYRSYPYIIKWIEDGSLSDKNVDPRGLAGQIRSVTNKPGEIIAVASVLSAQDKKQEASMLCRIAYELFPDYANYDWYAQVFTENEEYDDALFMLKKALIKTTEWEKMEEILKQYDSLKSLQK